MPTDLPITCGRMDIADLEEVLDFNRASFPDDPRKSDEEYWRWHFLKNPNADPGLVPVWLARCDDKIVGQVNAHPIELNVAGHAVKASWFVDVVVTAEMRRRGVMRKLFDELGKCYEYGLGIATDRQYSSRMVSNFGWCVFPRVPRFAKLLYPGEAVRELGKIRPIRSIVNAAFSPWRRRDRTLRSVTVRQLDGFDASFDQFWLRARDQWRCSVTRSSAMLDWLYRQQPGKKFNVLGCFDGDTLCGYAVTYERRANLAGAVDKLSISDLCYDPSHPETTVDALFAYIVNGAIDRRVGSIVTDIIDPLITDVIKNFGFVRSSSRLEMMVNGPEHKAELCNINNWFLTRGDSDITLFEPTNI
ncbi:MAG: GNAT family N-acetyltransferase [Pyrinomonadaceae bacterium]